MADTQKITVMALVAMTADELRSKRDHGENEVVTTQGVFRGSNKYLWPNRMRASGLDEAHVLDLPLLDDRLRSVSRSDSEPSLQSPKGSGYSTPDPNDPENKVELISMQLRSEEKAYHHIIQDGGRPSHKPKEGPDFEFLEQPEYQTPIVKYWKSRCNYRPTLLTQQKFCWNEYREYQDRERRKWGDDPHLFAKRVEYIQKYLADKGITHDVRILADRHQQSSLADWVEYLFFQHCAFDGLKEKLRLHEQEHACGGEQQTVNGRSRRETTKMEPGVVNMAHRESCRSDQEINVELHSVLLDWIAEQVALIASESLHSEAGGMSTSGSSTELREQETLGDKPAVLERACADNSRRDLLANNQNDLNGATMSSSSPGKTQTPNPAEIDDEPARTLPQENDEIEQQVMAVAIEIPLPEEDLSHDDSIASEPISLKQRTCPSSAADPSPATLWHILESS